MARSVQQKPPPDSLPAEQPLRQLPFRIIDGTLNRQPCKYLQYDRDYLMPDGTVSHLTDTIPVGTYSESQVNVFSPIGDAVLRLMRMYHEERRDLLVARRRVEELETQARLEEAHKKELEDRVKELERQLRKKE